MVYTEKTANLAALKSATENRSIRPNNLNKSKKSKWSRLSNIINTGATNFSEKLTKTFLLERGTELLEGRTIIGCSIELIVAALHDTNGSMKLSIMLLGWAKVLTKPMLSHRHFTGNL